MRHKFSFLLTALLLFSLLIVPVGSASALTNYVQDPSFEAAYTSTAIWQQTSTNSGSPLCTVADCDNDGGTAGPRTGPVWAWFGGIDFTDPDYTSPENSSVSQNVTFPNSCGVQLQFYLWIGKAPTGSGVDDVLNAKVDNTTVFSVNATQKASYPSYTLVTVGLSASLANGAAHTVRFDSTTSGQTVTFNVDDVAVVSTCFTISGNAGTPGATINYTGGSTTADGSGNYTFTVPADWNGTVTPSKTGFVFSPPSRTYTAVAANQTAQDYTGFVGFTISGTVSGVTGWSNPVTLSYTDGTPKTVTTQPDGSYTIPVPAAWNGTVTPSHPCFNFTPANRPYTNVTSDKPNQNFTATFNNSAPLCAVTVGVFRPSNGALYLKNSNTTGFADVQINYGIGGDYPIAGDWDGNGTATIGIYRNGVFYLRNSNTIGFADVVFAFGMPGDQPIAGDWDNNGTDTIGVYRNGAFFLRNSNSTGPAEMIFGLGIAGDVGIAGDWNHDGFDTAGVFRPSNGALYLKDTNTTGFADIQINYGIAGDKPVVGDWNNDGTDTIGVYRNGTFYLRNTNTIGFADIVFDLGIPGDMPIAGNWDAKP
jgi:hypothetical protein